jgi:nucleoside-diphosphate-sugar epimerase
LRYGGFYGPGTAISLSPDAQMAAPIRKRRFPIIGDGGGVFSHIHVDHAAAATVAAVDHGQPGIRRIPRWLGRLAAGEAATLVMTEARGASNAKAKRELGWQPRYATWRQGFAQGLG